jgi:hypothetical protein
MLSSKLRWVAVLASNSVLLDAITRSVDRYEDVAETFYHNTAVVFCCMLDRPGQQDEG